MSNRKLSLQGFFRKSGRFYRKITKSFVNSVLRSVLLYQRRGKLSNAGFILPTTVLLILVVALTVGALTFRAYNRNVQVIGEAQQRIIYNAATPAIDRARSKLEFLFDPLKDVRLPSGVPSQATLQAMLLNNGTSLAKLPYADASGNQVDAYTFPDETRIDINGGGLDNAWYFRTDTNGDGVLDTKDSTVVYSITLSTPPATPATQTTQAKSIATWLLQLSAADKAKNLWVRQAPLSVDGALGCAANTNGGNAGPDGWFEDKISTAKLRKNFQVDALVIPGNSSGTKTTLEFTQERQLDRGNKWGAWFRHDMEIYPGPQFNWNGAMHTEGSLIIGGNSFSAYLISAPNSCLYYPASNSEITTANKNDGTDSSNLLGLVASGVVKDGNSGGSSSIHRHSNNPTATIATLDTTTDSSAVSNPFDITIDPATVVLKNGYTNVPPGASVMVAPGPAITKTNPTDRSNRGANANLAKTNLPDFKNQDGSQRIAANSADAPYVDDLYRADDRWGPKPKYKTDVVPDKQFGQPIPSSYFQLLNNTVAATDPDASNVGLDGYWERRARVRGLRILVGQRLELGNLFTWYAPQDKNNDGRVGYGGTAASQLDQGTSTTGYEYEGDPLYPPTVRPYPIDASGTLPIGLLSHVDQQRRTLRDNLSAVQSTAIYHASYSDQDDYPVACLATTSHPGTLWTIRQALTFRPFSFSGTDQNGVASSTPTSLLTNFFTGVGTNGWEFAPPAGDVNSYNTQIQNPNSALRIALQNLANFAGDHQSINGTLKSGAYPPTPNDTVIHPYPALSMWGDYSNLKRALSTLSTNSNDISKLSVADQTYLQTAACTLGMLAYNIDRIQKFDPSAINGANAANDKVLGSSANKRTLMAKLGRDLWRLMDGINDITSDPSNPNPEVLPKEQLSTYSYSASGFPPQGTPPRIYRLDQYNARDYDGVTPEALIAALRQYLLAYGKATDGTTSLKPDHPEFVDEMRMAETIMLNHQIRRDRTFGFKPSPRFGKYFVFPSGMNAPVDMVTACDPDQFAFSSGADGDADFIAAMRGRDIISKTSTTLNAIGLNAVSLSSPLNNSFPVPTITNVQRELSQYRLALSRLCGTLDASGKQVLPKFPALYYLFPEVDHDYDGDPSVGGYDHQQPPTEPYIADSYVQSINAQFQSGTLPFRQISTAAATGRAGYPSAAFSIPAAIDPILTEYQALSRKPDPASIPTFSVRVFPIADRLVSDIALQPRPMSQWQLPYLTTPKSYNTASTTGDDKANFSTNIILNGADPADVTKLVSVTPDAVSFLDRAFFDGRQLMTVRTLDLDIGLLRSTRLSTPQGATNDVWLPVSGIIYAYREDAVREDMISRPACTGTNCTMNLQNPANPVDPAVLPANSTRTTLDPGENGISLKSIDPLPDPERRVRGFRLRNGAQVMRNRSFEGTSGFINAADNNKGLSFFTDQPVYIQGSFNLHQSGNDDTMGSLIEEFTQTLPAGFDANTFYGRTTINPDFATLNADRWRPSEVIADSITILSNGFCDGSIADTFLQYNGTAVAQGFGSSTYPVPDADVLNMGSASANRSYYNSISGLFDPGCVSSNFTSFHNQNRPAQTLATKTAGNRDGWDWVRENSRYDAIANRRVNSGRNQNSTGHWVDITAPVKISRAGQPLVVRPRDTTISGEAASNQPLPPIPYNVQAPTQTYYSYGVNVNNGFSANNPNANSGSNLIDALPSQVNTIVVSGISPSRPKQGYGGLHNFPRFVEDWDQKDLSFSGSFIQLSYTNYATAPFDLENLEPAWTGVATLVEPNNENIIYYRPPNRRWGYDVALQYSPASPAAARFVNLGKDRNEYYLEPPANDPYIVNLCQAAKTALNLNTSCPGGS
ncbi:MAG: hypothetical protein C4288_08555 [Leptolyngbya sp. ERB_1_1]